MYMNLNWRNLQQNKCPQCSSDFVKSLINTTPSLLCECGFTIKKDEYRRIVTDKIRARIDQEAEEEKQLV